MQHEFPIWYLENVDMFDFLCPGKMDASGLGGGHEPSYVFNKGDFIYFPDQEAAEIYLLTSGRVKVGSYSEDGKEIIKAVLQPGELFGEMVMIGERVRKDFAVAMDDDVGICSMSFRKMQRLLFENVDFSLKLSQAIGRKLVRMERRVESLVFKDARTRIVEFLRELALQKGDRQGDVVQVDHFFTHRDIASLTATSRQTVTSVLNDLRSEGLIDFTRRSLYIPSMQKLA
ncbi:MAG: Crp/Fnr family transcriptional regulator [Bacteroidota bacterium]